MAASNEDEELALPLRIGDDGRQGAYSRFYTPGSRIDREFKLMRRMNRISRLWRIRLDQNLRMLGQTYSRWEILLFITLWGGGQTQVQFAKLLGLEGPSLVRMLDKLEEDGLVRRSPSPGDRRAKLVYTTEAGEALVERVVGISDRLRGELLEGVDDKDIEHALDVVDVILTRLER